MVVERLEEEVIMVVGMSGGMKYGFCFGGRGEGEGEREGGGGGGGGG